MRRSERIFRAAAREGWLCAVTGSAVCAAGVWAAVAWLHDSTPGGVLGALSAAVAFRLALWHGAEWIRLRCLARNEIQWERKRYGT